MSANIARFILPTTFLLIESYSRFDVQTPKTLKSKKSPPRWR